jgi:hypothetical protein
VIFNRSYAESKCKEAENDEHVLPCHFEDYYQEAKHGYDVEWLDVVHFELKHGDGRERKEVGGVSARLNLVRLLKSHHDGGDSWRCIRDQGSRMFEMRPLLS